MAVLTTNKEIAAIVKRANANLKDTIKATEVRYHPKLDVLELRLSNGTRCLLPREQLQGLQDATRRQIADFKVVGGGTGIHWPDLDADLWVEGLINGVYGTKQWMTELGKKGGSVRSESKTEAARLNGLKGGRPARVAKQRTRTK